MALLPFAVHRVGRAAPAVTQRLVAPACVIGATRSMRVLPTLGSSWLGGVRCGSSATVGGAGSPVPAAVAAARELLQGLGPGSVKLEYPADMPGVAVLTLSSAARRNALSPAMMVQLGAAIEELSRYDGKGVIVRGEGATFCAGADLTAAATSLSGKQAGGAMCDFMQHYLMRLHALPLLSVALVEGAAVGGGAELTTACDFRVITRTGFIQFVHGKMGLVPGWGGGVRLTHLAGRRTALQLLTSGKRLVGPAAVEAGLADQVVDVTDAKDALAAAFAFLQPMLVPEPQVVRGLKTVVATAATADTQKALQVSHEQFGLLWGGPASTAAIARADAERKSPKTPKASA